MRHRFAAALDRLVPAAEAIGLAVSGGPDSLGLLKLALDDGRRPLRVATVDHGLRAGSADEAVGVAALCRSLGVAHDTLTPAHPIGERNVQARARVARYAALRVWAGRHDLGAVATGHQMDDQAETLAMRFVRGSGLHGLAGVRARLVLADRPGPPFAIVRPCLGLRRAELAAVVAAAGWCAVDDPANIDSRFDRARMRAHLPATAVPGLMRSAEALGEASDALRWAEGQAAALAWREADGAVTIAPAGLPAALLRALLTRAVHRLAPDASPPSGPEGDRLLARLHAGGTATLRGLSFAGDTPWRIAPAPAPSHDCKTRSAPYLETMPFSPDARE